MSAITDDREWILAYAKQMTIGEEKFKTFNEEIKKKLIERDLQARDAKMQPELNRIYKAYRTAVEGHKENLKAQYELGKNLILKIQEIEKEEDLANVGVILTEFQIAIKTLLEEHKKLEEEINIFEGKIISLLPVNTQIT